MNRVLGRRRIAATVLAALVSLSATACGDDDAAAPPVDDGGVVSITTTTVTPEAGSLDIPEIPDTFAVPVPSLGFGIAVPAGWQVTLLSPDALARIEDAALADPFFLEAARTVAESGAVLYGAGIDDLGRVAELKVDVQEDAADEVADVAALAESLVVSGALGDDAEVVDDGADVRIVYRQTLPSAEDGAPIETVGSQRFVVDGSRLWSVIVTAEDAGTLAALVDLFDRSFVLD